MEYALFSEAKTIKSKVIGSRILPVPCLNGYILNESVIKCKKELHFHGFQHFRQDMLPILSKTKI